jgi:beta-lactamase superfamily II metal-dependent hydrolase
LVIPNDPLEWRRGWSSRVRRTVIPIAALGALILVGTIAFLIGLWLHENRPDDPKLASGPTLQLRCPQIGDGDGAVVAAPQGDAVVIDAGSSALEGRALADQLSQSNSGNLAALIITSATQNCIGGASELLDMVSLRGPVILPCGSRSFIRAGGRTARAFIQSVHAHNLKAWIWQDYQQAHPGLLDSSAVMRVSCLPAGPLQDRQPHIAVRVDYGSESLLYAASLTPNAESFLSAQQAPLNCDLLVVPGNGAKDAASSEFLAWAAPRVAVISCPVTAAPDPQTTQRLQAAGAKIYRTDLLNGVYVGMGNEPEQLLAGKPIEAAPVLSSATASITR